jgi:thioredoxin 1
MKKQWISLMVVASALLFSCNQQSAQVTKNSQPEKTAAVKESKQITAAQTTPEHLTKQAFLDKVMDYEKNPKEWVFKGDKPCVIDFYADWCPPCRITSPIMEELAKEYAGKINVYKVNVDKEQELAALFGIQSIPSFLYCPMNGKPSMSSGIAQSKEETKAMFKQQIETLLLNNNKTSSNL